MTQRKDAPRPYQGLLVWIARGSYWSIAVSDLQAVEIFDETVLRSHLSRNFMPTHDVTIEGGECKVKIGRGRSALDIQRRDLLAVLREHYRSHKGRRIEWASA